MQSGDDDGAATDFHEAASADPDSAAAAQAHFFLGVLAASASRVDEAKAEFAHLQRFPELQQAGEDVLKSLPP